MSASSHPTSPATVGETLPSDAVEVGRVLGAWGVKGAIRVKPFAADPQALFSSKRWYLLPSEQPRPAGAKSAAVPPPPLLRVVQAKEHGDAVVASVQDLNDRDAAQALSGARVYVARTSFPTPDEGEFYWVDLIGCEVLNRQGQTLGVVTGLIETGPHCVLRVSPAGDVGAHGAAAAERLIPFVDAYVDGVDLAQRRIVTDWGLDF